MTRASLFAGACLLLAFTLPIGAEDWPQWRGPGRNGVSREAGWSARWGEEGPKKPWSMKVGLGYSAVAVRGDRVYTMGGQDDQDSVYCINANSGVVLWKQSYPCATMRPMWPASQGGPRSTPAVEGDRVYTLSHAGDALCLDAETGKKIWQVNVKEATGSRDVLWGYGGSPLVHGNLVIYNIGAGGAALDRETGKVVWQSSQGGNEYASPVAFTVNGKTAVAISSIAGLVAVDPVTGQRLWRHPMFALADPIFSGDTVFVSGPEPSREMNFENIPFKCALLRIGGEKPEVVWENRSLRNQVNSSVLVGDYLFGNDQNSLRCLELKTGAERWGERGFGKGGLMAAGDRLIALTERGELVVVKATPEKYEELARAQLPRGKYWTHPVLANGRIYCRSQEGDLTCLDVRAPAS